MPTFGTPTYNGSNQNVSTITIPKPTDLIVGKILVVALRSQDGTTAGVWNAPAGFTLQSAPFPASMPQAGSRVGAIYTKVITEADLNVAVTGYTFTGPTGRNVGVAIRFDPDMTGDLVNVGYHPYGGTSSTGGIVTFAARNTSGLGVTFLLLAAETTAGIVHTNVVKPSDFIQLGNVQSSLNDSSAGSRTSIWFGYKVETSTSIPGFSGGWTGSSSVAGYAATLAGGAPVPPSTPGLNIELQNGTVGKLSIVNSAGLEIVPTRIQLLRPGFFTVAESLQVPGCTMGHRGASAAPGMPEMSERGFDFTVLTGHPMLEFSCGRSSDGVWFGLHDQNLNRTSETTGLGNVSTMTWAQIQAYFNSLNSGGSPTPYYKLSDFLLKYADTHVLHVDPKYGLSMMSDFLDQLDLYGGPTPEIARTRIVVKFVGGGTGSQNVANMSRARGYKCAVYLYDTDVTSGSFDANQGYWDYVGINYGSTQEIFETVKSYNKPVVVHIMQHQAAYDIAKTKIEANGWVNPALGRTWIAQCSGTHLIKPVR